MKGEIIGSTFID